jgi:hypothetical protein
MPDRFIVSIVMRMIKFIEVSENSAGELISQPHIASYMRSPSLPCLTILNHENLQIGYRLEGRVVKR